MATIIGNYITNELKQQGKDQAWLAEQTGLSTSAISAITTGKTRLPAPATVKALALALGVEGARLTAMLGYPIDMGGNVARYAELSLRLESNPELAARLPDLLALSAERFRDLMAYLDHRYPRNRSRRSGRGTNRP